ncbi:MAG: hypothetical protein IKO84_08430 [Butyrivibrio sp.]|nr:hypothetical protein [Butyrivibrio sp.]
MNKSYLNKGIILVLVGICLVIAAIFTKSAFDGLLWGLAGGALGPGIGILIKHFYLSVPKNQERYQESLEQKEINVHDELNEKLRDRSGRIAYNIGLYILCFSVVLFAILGKAGMIIDHKIIVLYLVGFMILQYVIGIGVYHQLRKKY